MQILRMWEMGLMGIRNRTNAMTSATSANHFVLTRVAGDAKTIAISVDNRRRVRPKLSPLQ